MITQWGKNQVAQVCHLWWCLESCLNLTQIYIYAMWKLLLLMISMRVCYNQYHGLLRYSKLPPVNVLKVAY